MARELGRSWWLFALGMLGIGCARAPGRRAPEKGAAGAAGEPLPLPLAVRFTLVGDDPDGLLTEAIREAAARWAKATGVDIAMAPLGSSPVALNTIQWAPPEEFVHPDGLFRLGHTDVWPVDPALYSYENYASSIHVNTAGNPALLMTTILHEMGHVLAQNTGHIDTGLMGAKTHDPNLSLDVESIAFVCRSLPCSHIAPEV